jgi:hypothetical protein
VAQSLEQAPFTSWDRGFDSRYGLMWKDFNLKESVVVGILWVLRFPLKEGFTRRNFARGAEFFRLSCDFPDGTK